MYLITLSLIYARFDSMIQRLFVNLIMPISKGPLNVGCSTALKAVPVGLLLTTNQVKMFFYIPFMCNCLVLYLVHYQPGVECSHNSASKKRIPEHVPATNLSQSRRIVRYSAYIRSAASITA